MKIDFCPFHELYLAASFFWLNNPESQPLVMSGMSQKKDRWSGSISLLIAKITKSGACRQMGFQSVQME